jgi:hypothetical protein
VERPNVVADGDAPSSADRATLPISLLCVEEEALVKAAHGAKRFATDEEYSSNRKLDTPPQRAQSDRLDPGASRTRERPPNSVDRARRAPPLRRCHAGEARIRQKAVAQLRDGCRVDFGVGVQQQHINLGEVELSEGEIYSGRKAEIRSGIAVLGAGGPGNRANLDARGIVDHEDRYGTVKPRETSPH